MIKGFLQYNNNKLKFLDSNNKKERMINPIDFLLKISCLLDVYIFPYLVCVLYLE